MNRMALVAIFLIMMASVVSAECITNKGTTMYFNMDRLLRVARVTTISEQQGLSMMIDDLQQGVAVGVPTGTRIESIRRVLSEPTISVVKIKGISLISLTTAISCRGKNEM